jgi:N-acetyl-gamma-glutamyl-phosphate reductase
MINVAIVGVSGYTGIELIKILINHPNFDIKYIANTKGNTTSSTLHPCLQNVCEIDVSKSNSNDISKVASLCFLALPHKASMSLAKELLDLGVKVIDLSADYRLDINSYEKYYTKHIDKKNLSQAIYGLSEYFKDDLKNSSLVANPGCYPTACLLAILPFIPYINEGCEVFIDAKSGVSGAGKIANDINHYCNINENSFAYNPFHHRHSPEIKEKIKKITNKDIKINFVPHLLPLTRGMLVSIYATLKKDINVEDILNNRYKNSPFIRIKKSPVDIKSTSGTNFCDIYAIKNDKALFITSSIDNLLRGASSQAVVNANIMYGYKETLGIPSIAYVP